jgi:hypothetical protein
MAITLKVLKSYLIKNGVITTFISYEIFAIILSISTDINITIPCLYQIFFDVKCPSCGLTSATILLLEGEFHRSIHTNPLIIVIIPAMTSLTYMDFKKFTNELFLK